MFPTPDATLLYFVRHGETDYNRDRIVQGRRINSSLNATGRAQAAALAARLAGERIEVIYSSTLNRALETAQIVAAEQPRALPLVALADLEEMSWGRYDGEKASPYLDAFIDTMHAAWNAGNYAYRIPDGETILEVQSRSLRAMRHILAQHGGKTVLIVTHGRLLRVLLASLLPAFGLARMQDLAHANTGLYQLAYTDGQFEMVLANDISHLQTPESLLVE